MYQRILAATDGSETAAIAESVATGVARGLAASLTVFTAFDPERTESARAEEVVAAAIERARQVGVEATMELGTGDPADAIMEAAAAVGADLIVVGDRGMGRARRFALGGVPDRVSHYSPVDLLIVRTGRRRGTPAEKAPYHKVLIATDGSFTADLAASRGHELAAGMGADSTLVFVGDELVGNIVVRDTAERLGNPDIERRVLRGDPATRICRLAKAEGHDLIVVGNKGMTGARRFLLSAVPNEVSHQAQCDVLICKTVGRSLHDLQPGDGAVIDREGHKVAAFIDESGAVHAVAARCTHLGCTVGWNSKDRTWDCPCHGSRFDISGNVIDGPALRPLPTVDISAGPSRASAVPSPTGTDGVSSVKSYQGDAITVFYDPSRCLHFAECVRGLPSVFDKDRRPWVSPDQADPTDVADVIRRCPTGALHYELRSGRAERPTTPTSLGRIDGGPLLARGDLLIGTASGELRETRAALCQCGATTNAPFCDGACGFST